MINLTVEKREIATNLSGLRTKGFIPAVFYGHKQASTPISIKETDFLKVWKQAGESSIVHLTGKDIDHEVLIQDIDLDPVTDKVRHADFYVIEKGKKVAVHIPLEFTGISPAVRDLGGILVKVLHELEIEAMPKDLPHNLSVDVSSLATLEDRIFAKNVVLPAGVTLLTNPDEVVASVAQAVEEVLELAPIDLTAIEVEKKGKEVKEGETEVPAGGAKPEAKPEAKQAKPKEGAAK
jgi:large subunit ribosomal protein L25